MLVAFGSFPGRKNHRSRGDAGGAERVAEAIEMKAGDVFVGDDRGDWTFEERRKAFPGLLEQAGGDGDIIAPIRERHAHGRVPAFSPHHRSPDSSLAIAPSL